MTAMVVLDAGPMADLARRAQDLDEVRAVLRSAQRLNRPVIVPAVVLAELYRGAGPSHSVDAFLARAPMVEIRDTDRSLARVVGGVLVAADRGSTHLADAHVVATAVEAGGGVVVTSDPGDLGALATSFPNVTVVSA